MPVSRNRLSSSATRDALSVDRDGLVRSRYVGVHRYHRHVDEGDSHLLGSPQPPDAQVIRTAITIPPDRGCRQPTAAITAPPAAVSTTTNQGGHLARNNSANDIRSKEKSTGDLMLVVQSGW